MNATHSAPPTSARARTRSPVQLAALLFGLVFLVVGIAGFVPGVTADFDSIEMAARSEAMLLGIFQVSFLHNIIHLIFGLAGLGLSRVSRTARGYLLVGGIIYAVLWIYGLLVDKDSTANFVPLNSADDWLHFALALAMIGLSFLPRR
ncbi:hypothetical protein CFK38_04515 [Brachybacterium vulturis]|uniref:DUF4383 domain-containing protein n=1 Tax=Brachybacterium vulturis TaxID=2017484 RepID=A0A291GKJ6_9MICO|nr:DUF4383 domain-containing protein [Brachybacterium vulturis]ATG50869.1 hypothetical protein CFK38_04515 [Brachybacterium vulturis]